MQSHFNFSYRIVSQVVCRYTQFHYGFSFFDLADASPKTEKTKKSCAQAVRTLIATAILMAQMRLKRLLPIKELSEASGVIRKILERHRKYIIAAAEILDGDFPILAGYMAFIKKEL